jgi:hypothetical protein
MAAELTEEQKSILYFDWDTRYIRPRPRKQPLCEGDSYGADVLRNGKWIHLLEPICGTGMQESVCQTPEKVNYSIKYPDGRKEVYKDGKRMT